MKPVPILHLVPELGLGGRDRALLGVLARLDRDLFSVRIGTLTPPTIPAREAFEAARLSVVHIDDVRASAGRTAVGRLAARLHAVGTLRRTIAGLQPRITHTHGPWLNAYGALAARLAGVPHLMSHDWEVTNLPWRDRVLQRWSANLPDVAFVPTRHVAERRRQLLGIGNARVLVLPNGVDLQRLTPGSPAQRLTARAQLGLPVAGYLAGSVGPFVSRKRTAVLIDALAAIVARVPEAFLVLYGDGPEQVELLERARRAGVAERVFGLDWRQDALLVYQALDVCVTLTSDSGGSGHTLSQALACGLPVVASRTAVHEEIAARHALFVEARPRAVAEALVSLARSAAERLRRGSDARQHALAVLDIDVTARRLEAAYAHCVGCTPRPWASRQLVTARS